MKRRSFQSASPIVSILSALTITMILAGTAIAQTPKGYVKSERACCDLSDLGGIVWHGSDSLMTFDELAAYCAPIIWFSPDEPLLGKERGKAIRLPEHMGFEDDPDAPVLYYLLEKVVILKDVEGETVQIDSTTKGQSVIDLRNVRGVDLRFCVYYPSEVGLGGHPHDLEVVDMKVVVYTWSDWVETECRECTYVIQIQSVTGRAHGLLWYDNTLEVDEYTKFPIGIMAEEGKHANCPDKNLDGMYTPGFDVNKRVNDAWGIRDIIRGGALFTGGFQSWMNKVRLPEDRVFPPLPEDSPLRADHTKNGVYAPDNAIYELRTLPLKELAGDDHVLEHYIESKGEPDWPEEDAVSDFEKVGDWLVDESFVKSLSVALRVDDAIGVSFVFPFFIVKHLEDPMGGGWIVHRIYFQDHDLRDFGWGALYTTSASRWIDGYIVGGVEWDVQDITDATGAPATRTQNMFVMESGMKFRVQMKYSPLKFLTKLADFWGFRVGLIYKGNAFDFRKIGLVFEVGAGTF